ncbi:MAG TPA: glycosyltransferase family 4 protein [Gaiellaceae bacterium]|nr:glycosyltransferase family 4 protein [Gaiellaceae bacterium]
MIACLRRAGVEVDERHEPVWEGEWEAWRAGLRAALRLARAELRLLGARPMGRYDAVLVGYPGHADLWAARRAAHGAPVVFNPLVSLSDTFVADRRRFRPGSPAARALRALDRRALRAADLVVADTRAHADFLAELAGLDRVEVAFVGAEERLFSPGTTDRGAHALFVGKLIPLHGVETILEAARLAPEVPVRIVGSGQLERLLAGRPTNVEWVPWLEYERLPDEYRSAGFALGVFGRTEKAARVIPNKAFQALACATPLITADTPAARELLVDGTSALLVPAANAEALAAAMVRLAGDERLRTSLAEGGLAAYRAQASEEVLGRRWREIVESAR